MSLLFDIYLEQTKRGPSRYLDSDFYHKRSFVERTMKKYKDKPEVVEQTEKLLAAMEEHKDSVAKFNQTLKEFWKYQREAEKDFGLEAWNTEVIVADNVCQYYFDQADKNWGDEDFPVVSPPFELMWMEFARPRSANYPADWSSRFAFWIQSGEVPMDKSWEETTAKMLADKFEFRCPQKPRWLTRMMLYMRRMQVSPEHPADNVINDECLGPVAMWMMALNEKGEIISRDKGYIDDSRAKHVDVARLAHCALLTLSLMNCKNVTTKDNEPSAVASRKWKRKTGEPLASFKTLDIEPMRKVLVREGGETQQGLKRAMHICRGHFRDYRERGVFGKHKGIYWWDSFVRGNAEQGVVYKQYEVKQPRSEVMAG